MPVLGVWVAPQGGGGLVLRLVGRRRAPEVWLGLVHSTPAAGSWAAGRLGVPHHSTPNQQRTRIKWSPDTGSPNHVRPLFRKNVL